MRRRYVVRQAERMPLGTPFTVVVARVKSYVEQLRVKRPTIVVVPDESGLGVPVVEMMREAGLRRLTPLVITAGGSASGNHIPKVELVAKMKLMVERGELELAPGLLHGEELKRELAHLRFEGRSGGEKDDMAMALALACWRARVR
jgi:hypothetical protein